MPNAAPQDDEIGDNLARLRRLDCCAVSDALDRLKLLGVVTGIPQQSGSHRIAGLAVTVKLGTGDPPPGPPRHLGTTAIEASGPNNVIVVEQRTGVNAGSWGGLLTLGAKMRGVAGVVVDGPVRDIDEAIGYQYPIFTHTLTAFTARGRIVEKSTNTPVQVGSVMVQPGDYVIADRSAIAFISPTNIKAVLETAEMIADREAAMAKALLAGVSASQVMGGIYEHLLTSKPV
jgi:4-hydroxy-4-methyl-2-oxoglutarate aldolase